MWAKGVKLLLAAVIIMCASSPLFAQGRSTLRMVRFGGDMAGFLSQIAATYDVNIGLEADAGQPNAWIEVSVNDATLEDILDAVVQSAPKYQWRNEAGIVDVFPRATTNPILDRVVHRFQFTGNDWWQASYALTNLPEVQNQALAFNLRRQNLTRISQGKDANQFSINLDDATVRRTLHEITRKSGNRFWIFRQSGQEHSFSISIYPAEPGQQPRSFR